MDTFKQTDRVNQNYPGIPSTGPSVDTRASYAVKFENGFEFGQFQARYVDDMVMHYLPAFVKQSDSTNGIYEIGPNGTVQVELLQYNSFNERLLLSILKDKGVVATGRKIDGEREFQPLSPADSDISIDQSNAANTTNGISRIFKKIQSLLGVNE